MFILIFFNCAAPVVPPPVAEDRFGSAIISQDPESSLLPKGHSVIDKALAWHDGGRGSNPGHNQEQIHKMCSHPLWYPTMWTLSLTMPVVTCTSVNTCHGDVKREESWKSYRDQLERRSLWIILAAPSVRWNTDISVLYGKGRGKKAFPDIIGCWMIVASPVKALRIFHHSHHLCHHFFLPRLRKHFGWPGWKKIIILCSTSGAQFVANPYVLSDQKDLWGWYLWVSS